MRRNLLLILFFALIIAVFSIQNAGAVSISLFKWNYQVSLVIIVLGAIALGAIIMALFTYFNQFKMRRELRRLKQEKKTLEETKQVLQTRISQLQELQDSADGQEEINQGRQESGQVYDNGFQKDREREDREQELTSEWGNEAENRPGQDEKPPE